MGHYAYELEESTTLINKADFDTVLSKIKKEVNKDKWKGYGWRDSVLNAKTLEDVITKEFGIQLVDEDEGYYRPVINNVYVSNFFSYLIEIVAPFMTDGEIRVDDEYGIKTIEFEDAKVTVIDENEISTNDSKKCDKKTEKGKEYKFLVSMCGGWCNGTLSFYAEDEDEAYEKAMDYVGDKLSDAFPELDIPYNVESYEEDGD